jgi:uncharacterized protein (PEP-CTERM system associated)
MARTSFRYSDVKDISTGFNQAPTGQTSATYDVLFAQFAAIEPDPIRRAVLVNEYLRQLGIGPGFLTLQRRKELSVSYQAVRQTYTLAATQTDVQRLNQAAPVNPDSEFVNPLRLRGVSATVSHRLTPQTSLNLNGSIDQTRESGESNASDLRALSLVWSGQLGLRSSFSLGARHVWFDSDRSDGSSSGYREKAIFGTLSRSF